MRLAKEGIDFLLYLHTSHMRKVIYTCIVGGYDELRQPEIVDPSFDCICFSDDFQESRIGVWEILPIPYACGDATRLSRYVKILPHKALPDYEVSVWVDANIQITGHEFYNYLSAAIDSGVLIAQVPHPSFECVYDDMRAIAIMDRESFREVYRQYRHLKKEGFPSGYGMFENNLILRFHNNPTVIAVSEEWWQEYNTYSTRDQFSLMYLYWKHGMVVPSLLGDRVNSRNAPFLKVYGHSVYRHVQGKGIGKVLKKIHWTIVRWMTRLLIK